MLHWVPSSDRFFFLIPTVTVFLTILASSHWTKIKWPLMTWKHWQSGILFAYNYIVILDILPWRGNLHLDHERGYVFSTFMRLWLCYSKDMDRYTVRPRSKACASRTQCHIFRPQALYYKMANCKLLTCRRGLRQVSKNIKFLSYLTTGWTWMPNDGKSYIWMSVGCSHGFNQIGHWQCMRTMDIHSIVQYECMKLPLILSKNVQYHHTSL